jgi:hypothetical protein
MSNESLKVYVVQESVDLGYEIDSVYFNEFHAILRVQHLKSKHKYPNMSCSHYIYEELIVK